MATPDTEFSVAIDRALKLDFEADPFHPLKNYVGHVNLPDVTVNVKVQRLAAAQPVQNKPARPSQSAATQS